jgi:PIN domain nuclease of toxin-antitoxin system
VWAGLTPEVAVLSTRLPGEPLADLADRMIVATALRLGCALVTPDRALHAYPFVPTVW